VLNLSWIANICGRRDSRQKKQPGKKRGSSQRKQRRSASSSVPSSVLVAHFLLAYVVLDYASEISIVRWQIRQTARSHMVAPLICDQVVKTDVLRGFTFL
jgi:hypothetical protein